MEICSSFSYYLRHQKCPQPYVLERWDHSLWEHHSFVPDIFQCKLPHQHKTAVNIGFRNCFIEFTARRKIVSLFYLLTLLEFSRRICNKRKTRSFKPIIDIISPFITLLIISEKGYF